MRNFKNVLWGVVFIVLGIVLGVNALGIKEIDLFFNGWWTLFIIVPCFIGLFNDHDKIGNAIGLVIGILLLLATRDIINFDIIWKLAFPVILVVIGLLFIFKNILSDKITKKVKKSKTNNEYVATFSTGKANFNNEKFDGCTVNSIFGGYEINLCNALITEDIIIDAVAVFGGIDIKVDNTVNVKVNSTSIFGGVDNKIANNKDNKVTVYVNATCLFGGVDIK